MFLFMLTRTSVCCIFVTKDVINVKKVLVNYGGLLLFYLIIVLGVLFLCTNGAPSTAKPSGFTTSIGANK